MPRRYVYITIAEAVERFGLNRKSLSRAAKAGRLRTKIGLRGYLTTEQWIADWRTNWPVGHPRKEQQA